MENELNKLIEQQNKEYEKEALGYDDEDAQSNADIDDFEQRLKMNRSQMGFDDSDDDDDSSYKKASKSPVKKPEYNYNPPKQTRPLLSDEPDLLKQVQEMHQNKNKSATKPPKSSDTQSEIIKQKQDVQQKVEEEKALEILSSNNTSLKDKKLKELIQKNKELYVNLEKEKTMRQKLQKDIERIKEETDMHLAVMEGKPKGAKQQQDENDWKKKYIDLEKKLQESKLLNTTMKNDLNKAMRVISKEIGENVNIDTILSQENSWKGRAQQIEVLKARVKELQAKVAGPGNFSDISYITDKSQDMAGMGGMGGDRATSRSTSLVGGKPKERREEMEALKAQVDSLKAENDSLVEKVKALSSRKTILEKDIKDCKNEFERAKQILIDKSENDDKYIAALKREVEKSRMASPTIQTRIVYRDKPQEVRKVEPDEAEDIMAKKELNILKNELDKREKIIKELINEKLKHEANNMHRENIIQENISEGEKIVKLETMIKILKQENEELSNVKLGIKTTTPDSKIIKDLSLQNAQLRRKVDDLQTKLKAYQ